MAGFPKAGAFTEIGRWGESLAGPGSLFPFVTHNKGPGRMKRCGDNYVYPMIWERDRVLQRIGQCEVIQPNES
jgi:hypothetical protein